jgi:hypothetical protein
MWRKCRSLLLDRSTIDAELAADRPNRGYALPKRMRLSDAARTSYQSPAIALSIGVMLVT